MIGMGIVVDADDRGPPSNPASNTTNNSHNDISIINTNSTSRPTRNSYQHPYHQDSGVYQPSAGNSNNHNNHDSIPSHQTSNYTSNHSPPSQKNYVDGSSHLPVVPPFHDRHRNHLHRRLIQLQSYHSVFDHDGHHTTVFHEDRRVSCMPLGQLGTPLSCLNPCSCQDAA